MTSWTERMHRGALTITDVVTACGQPSYGPVHSRRIEKVKFGHVLEDVYKNDIPGPLLVLILKINKEGPNKNAIFRAPGNQANMKKLTYFLQNGRLVNIDNYSVYTIASVLKKFIKLIPNGIFGRENEIELFNLIELDDVQYQRDHVHQIITSLPVINQHILVLLLGTFRVIALSSTRAQTGMTSEALGVSVAPSFFQLCGPDGKNASMKDVIRYKTASKIIRFLIDNFGVSNMMGRSNYEYYARITGRVLKVEDDWIFAFRYPPDCLLAPAIPFFDETQSTPALVHFPECLMGYEQDRTHERTIDFRHHDEMEEEVMKAMNYSQSECEDCGTNEPCARLSASLEENGLYKVHERQKQRMESRSQWFLNPSWRDTTSLTAVDNYPHEIHSYAHPIRSLYLIHSAESVADEVSREKI